MTMKIPELSAVLFVAAKRVKHTRVDLTFSPVSSMWSERALLSAKSSTLRTCMINNTSALCILNLGILSLRNRITVLLLEVRGECGYDQVSVINQSQSINQSAASHISFLYTVSRTEASPAERAIILFSIDSLSVYVGQRARSVGILRKLGDAGYTK